MKGNLVGVVKNGATFLSATLQENDEDCIELDWLHASYNSPKLASVLYEPLQTQQMFYFLIIKFSTSDASFLSFT